jgi:predicted RNA binding protein YcfA (HicA-like mRNA interferase family)
LLGRDGCLLDRPRGDHLQFNHLTERGLVTVQHPHKDVPNGTLSKI